MKVAVVEDREIDRTYVESMLKNWGKTKNTDVKVMTFPSAESFLFEYEDDKLWDFLLLNIEMGGMNGVDLAKTIRQKNIWHEYLGEKGKALMVFPSK